MKGSKVRWEDEAQFNAFCPCSQFWIKKILPYSLLGDPGKEGEKLTQANSYLLVPETRILIACKMGLLCPIYQKSLRVFIMAEWET